jgi:hypothetical protein
MGLANSQDLQYKRERIGMEKGMAELQKLNPSPSSVRPLFSLDLLLPHGEVALQKQLCIHLMSRLSLVAT